tara:strand:+ start:115546 stop:116904 length:1359 start_codon:yes stop_codon:yes gene_type:complete
MADSEETIVVGGGFAGLVSAYLLAKEGSAVTVVSRAPLGGIAGGIAWRDFSLDLGCHIFGNSDDQTTEVLLALLKDDVLPVHMRFASHFGGERLEGFEIPDLAAVEDSAQMIFEIAQAAAIEHTPAENLSELLVQRFGPTAANAAAMAFEKIYRTSPAKVAPEAIAATCFKRIRVAEDEVARILKQSPAMDAVIAAGSQEDPMKFYRQCERAAYRAFYPASGGMAGFVRSAKRVLESMQVRFAVGCAIESIDLGERVSVRTSSDVFTADSCVWTAGLEVLEKTLLGTRTLAGTSYGVPMALYYYDIDQAQSGEYSYVNNFDSRDMVFRAALPGSYGQGTNCPEGRRYLCCEVPTDLDSPIFASPDAFAEKVWNEACALGVVHGTYENFRTLTTPVSYKVPMAHYAVAAKPIRAQLSADPRLAIADEWAFTKNGIIVDVERRIGAMKSTRSAA